MNAKRMLMSLTVIGMLMALASSPAAAQVLFYEDFQGLAEWNSPMDSTYDPINPPTIGTGSWYFPPVTNPGDPGGTIPYSKRQVRSNEAPETEQEDPANMSTWMYHMERSAGGPGGAVAAHVVFSPADITAMETAGGLQIEFLMYDQAGNSGAMGLAAYDSPDYDISNGNGAGVRFDMPWWDTYRPYITSVGNIWAHTDLSAPSDYIDTGITWYGGGTTGPTDWQHYKIIANFTTDTYTIWENDITTPEATNIPFNNTGVDFTKFTKVMFGGQPRGYTWNLDEILITAVTPITPLPGDADSDGDVDGDDAARLAANWQTVGSATWAKGDFNGDFNVDDLDATIMAANWTGSLAAVPEPSTFALLVLGGLMFLGRRRRG